MSSPLPLPSSQPETEGSKASSFFFEDLILNRLSSSKQFSFFFIPTEYLPPFSPIPVLLTFISVEIIAIVRGWKAIDHWSHLGGLLAGSLGGLYLRHRTALQHRRARRFVHALKDDSALAAAAAAAAQRYGGSNNDDRLRLRHRQQQQQQQQLNDGEKKK